MTSLALPHGGFAYPEGPADKDGADIFRAAVGYANGATYWRVDWNTLVSPNVPIAEWTFSTESATPASRQRLAGKRRGELLGHPVRADRLRPARRAA